jgi:NAD(P)H-binding
MTIRQFIISFVVVETTMTQFRPRLVWTTLLLWYLTEVKSFAILSSTIAASPSPLPPIAPKTTSRQAGGDSAAASSRGAAAGVTNKDPFAEVVPSTLLRTRDVVTTVAVTGATGKTGSLVVQELLDRGVTKVVAVVRNVTKARSVLAVSNDRLEIVECNLADESDIARVFTASLVDASIWCATGFARDEPVPVPQKEPVATKKAVGFWEQIMAAIGMQEPSKAVVTKAPPAAVAAMPPNPGRSIDLIGLPAIAKSLRQEEETKVDESSAPESMSVGADQLLPPMPLPKVVMCSSSGVTRPVWSETKKQKYRAAADIPIVRLNPFSILDRKRESEQLLRQSGVDYCIVRPCGLNDDWPANSRPVFSQGDVAVGRVNRQDLARVLVDVLSTPEAVGKTFEMVALAGYPRPLSIGPALARLVNDADRPDDDGDISLYTAYTIMQQLLPGEKQDSAGLAMGQTYEQLDTGVTGRLGQRGTENAEAAAPKPTS